MSKAEISSIGKASSFNKSVDDYWFTEKVPEPQKISKRGRISLSWKTATNDRTGELVQDYIFTEDYNPENTFGLITKTEILAVIERLKQCPEYVLFPSKFTVFKNLSKLLIFSSFLVFVSSWMILTVIQEELARMILFSILGITFLVVLSIGVLGFAFTKK